MANPHFLGMSKVHFKDYFVEYEVSYKKKIRVSVLAFENYEICSWN